MPCCFNQYNQRETMCFSNKVWAQKTC